MKPSSAEGNLHFGKLPPEMKCIIFSKLRPNELRRSRLVCKEWCELIDARHMLFSTILTNENAPVVINSRKHFASLGIMNTTQFPGMRTSTSRVIFPSVHYMAIKSGNSEAALFSILKTTRCKQLSIQSEALARVTDFGFSRFLPVINWDSLTELAIESEVPSLKHTLRLIQLFKMATLPNLKDLSLFIVGADSFSQIGILHPQALLVEFLKFTYRHSNSVIMLAINFLSLDLTTVGIHPDADAIIQKLQFSLNLHQFCSGLDGRLHTGPIVFLPCVLNSDRLFGFCFVITYLEATQDTQETVENVICKNSETLRTVHIGLNNINFDCFRDCRLLEALKISSKSMVINSQRIELPRLVYLEISQCCFTRSMADLIANNMGNLKHFLLDEWSGSLEDIPDVNLIQLLNAPKLLQIHFAWGIRLPVAFEIWSMMTRGMSWSMNLFYGTDLLIDRSIFKSNRTCKVPYPRHKIIKV